MGDAGRQPHVGRAMTRVNFHPAGTRIRRAVDLPMEQERDAPKAPKGGRRE